MAELPIPADNLTSALPGGNFLRGAIGMPLVRQLILVFALAGSVAMGVAAVLWMQDADFKPVTGAVAPFQVSEIIQVLDAQNIEHKLDAASGMVLVPTEQLHRARMVLAGSNVVDGRQLGYELLDQDQGFGVSQFTEVARHRRGLEGELARSIATITSVSSARVLLAVPKSTAFLRDRRKPSASVSVLVLPGSALSSVQVKGIVNLVAGAVPEMKAEDVTVIDQTGKLLSVQDEDPAFVESGRQLDYTQKVEEQLRRKIHRMLEPSLGAGRFSAEVSADVDFTRTEQTEELYNPDLTALRSEAAINEENSGEGANLGVPGTLSNDPATTEVTDGAAAGNEQRRSRSEITRNFEIDRTISHTQHAAGLITRITVSLVVDDLVAPATDEGSAEAGTAYEPWGEEDLQRLTELVKTAIGYSASRGDSVTVVNRSFVKPSFDLPEDPAFWTQGWFIDLIKQILGALVLLFLVIGLLRPLFRNLSEAGEVVKEQQSMAIANLAHQQLAVGQSDSGTANAGAASQNTALLASPGSSFANKVDTVRGLVDDDPERVAQVVKHWVSGDE